MSTEQNTLFNSKLFNSKFGAAREVKECQRCGYDDHDDLRHRPGGGWFCKDDSKCILRWLDNRDSQIAEDKPRCELCNNENPDTLHRMYGISWNCMDRANCIERSNNLGNQ